MLFTRLLMWTGPTRLKIMMAIQTSVAAVSRTVDGVGQCQMKPRRAKCRTKVVAIQKGMTLPNKAAKTCMTGRKRS